MERSSKRPLYFISGEDFYFLAYSILLVLEFLGGANKRFQDHRKITYLMQFLSDERLIGILERTQHKRVANPADRELLFASFTSAELHKREVYKILLSLAQRGYVMVERTKTAEILDIRLNSGSIPLNFFESSEFERERGNADKLKKSIPKISILSFDTLLERLYKDRGIQVWAA
ncbi:MULTISPECIES: hypothetical protein [unclassified Caballeronia]|uniref:hypothetical protein n=1 Tax=unclassified Caballeronia TaxID=2646786 RepID=UPI0020282869|nr:MULTISPECIES: hypothetical protein [unclassified Caballeronia]